MTVNANPAFANALKFVLLWEGGYVNHPDDPGGATNKGVTQKVYDAWRKAQGQAPQSVKAIADAEVHAIYEGQYWTPTRCPQLDTPLNIAQFDTAVNMGVGRAARFLQKAAGAAVDGQIGQGTLQCVAGCDAGELLVRYCDVREAFYQSLVQKNPKLRVFLKGWMNRLNALRKRLGLPGYESVDDEAADFGDVDHIGRIADLAEGVDDDGDGDMPQVQ